MDWLTKIWNSIKTTFTGGESTPVKPKTSVKQPIFHGTKRSTHHNEITMMSEISDEQIRTNSIRSRTLAFGRISSKASISLQKARMVWLSLS